jgi:hypothetical protein
MDRQPPRVLGHKGLRLGRGVIARAILDHDDRLIAACQDRRQKVTIPFGRKASSTALEEQAPAEIVESAQHFVALAFATGLHQRLLAAQGPGVAQRAPLGEGGLVAKQQQRAARSGVSLNGWPLLLAPVLTPLLVQMVGDEARLLIRKAQAAQQLTQIVDVIETPKLALDQILDQGTVPAARSIAGRFRSGADHCLELRPLADGQLGRAARRAASAQTVPAPHQKSGTPSVDRFGADGQPGGDLRNCAAIGQQQQRTNALDQPQRPSAPGQLQTVSQFLDSRPGKHYGKVHGIPPILVSGLESPSQNTVSRHTCHGLTDSFSEGL